MQLSLGRYYHKQWLGHQNATKPFCYNCSYHTITDCSAAFNCLAPCLNGLAYIEWTFYLRLLLSWTRCTRRDNAQYVYMATTQLKSVTTFIHITTCIIILSQITVALPSQVVYLQPRHLTCRERSSFSISNIATNKQRVHCCPFNKKLIDPLTPGIISILCC